MRTMRSGEQRPMPITGRGGEYSGHDWKTSPKRESDRHSAPQSEATNPCFDSHQLLTRFEDIFKDSNLWQHSVSLNQNCVSIGRAGVVYDEGIGRSRHHRLRLLSREVSSFPVPFRLMHTSYSDRMPGWATYCKRSSPVRTSPRPISIPISIPLNLL